MTQERKVLLAAGLESRTGKAAQDFRGLKGYLRNQGFSSEDFLELSYTDGPIYSSKDTLQPLKISTRHFVDQIKSVGQASPDAKLHAVGYSLGGVILFQSFSELLRENPNYWGNRLGSLTTLTSPLFGSTIDASDNWLEGFLMGEVDGLISKGMAVAELRARGINSKFPQEVIYHAKKLCAHGIKLLTLASEFDVVVTPEEAVIALDGEDRAKYILQVSGEGSTLKHGPILDSVKAWKMIAAMLK